jgi:hypothetical protein
MSEMSHHLNWLTEARQALQNPSTISAEKHADFLRLCDGILQQNPASDMTKDVKRQLEGLLSTPETKAVGRFDTVDLVTGANVVNIRMRPVSHELGSFVYEGLGNAMRETEGGGTADIRSFVERCNAEGPFPGFKEALPPGHLAILDAADHETCRSVYKQFCRLGLGNQVERLTASMNRGLRTHVAPLVDRMHSAAGKGSVRDVLALWETNLKNGSRNLYYRTSRENPEGGQIGREYAVPLMAQNPAYFSIGIMDAGTKTDNAGAGYDPLMRLVMMREKAAPNFMDALEAVHELTHVAQHGRFIELAGRSTRAELERSHGSYVAPLLGSDSSVHGILDEECEAFANMIELLFARVGFGTHNAPSILRTLGIPENETDGRHVLQLMELGAEYFKQAPRGRRFSTEYVRAVKELYERCGVTLHDAHSARP